MGDARDDLQFAVTPDGMKFKVVDAEGRTMIVCEEAANAEQYAALMNQSYQRGYKIGYHHGKELNRPGG